MSGGTTKVPKAKPTAKAVSERRPGRPKGSGLVADRTQLITAAVQAIRRHGPTATMDDVAAEAAVSKPIVYRQIGDKAALTLALSEWLIGEVERATGTAQASNPQPRARFRAVVHAYFSTIDEHRNVFLFVNASGHTSELLCRLVDRSAHGLVEQFEDQRARAGLDRVGARSWAYAIIGALQVEAAMWQRDEFRDLGRLADDLTHLLWDGLGTALSGG